MTPVDAGARPPADFGSRFAAFMIDTAALFIGQWMIFIVLSRQLQAAGMVTTGPCDADPAILCEGPSNALWAILLLLLVVTTIGYYAWCEGTFGSTPGKKLMGLVVVDEADEPNAPPIGMARATRRAVVRQAFWLSLIVLLDASPLGVSVPSVVVLVVPVLAMGLVAVGAFRSDLRGIHDVAARTRVVRAGSRPAPEDAEPADTAFGDLV